MWCLLKYVMPISSQSCGQPCSLQTQLLSGIAALVECYGELLSLCVTHCTLLPPTLASNSTILAKVCAMHGHGKSKIVFFAV